MLTTTKKKIELNLANLVKAIAFWNIHIENHRIQCAENQDFNVKTAYGLLDMTKKGHIDKTNIHNFMSSNKITLSHKECSEIMDILFEADQINQEEFEQFLLPQTNEKLREHQKSKDSWKSNKMVDRFTKQSMVQLFEKVLDSYRQCDKLRQILLSNEGQGSFDIHQLWRLINERNPDAYGNLSEQGLREFIVQCGAHWSQSEFKSILRHVRAEENQQFLSQSEFNKIVLPPLPTQSNAVFQYDKIQERIAQKYKDLGIEQINHSHNEKEKLSKDGYYNFRKVFDPLREGRPRFDLDKGKDYVNYTRQLKDYQERYCAPSRNPQLQYRHDITGVRTHDFFFQDYYLHLHQQDQDQLFYNRFGKKYLYDTMHKN